MTNEEILIDYQMCQMCDQRRNCIEDKRDRCTEYEDAIEILKAKDQQFKECLENKIHTIESMKDIDTTLPTDTAVVRAIKEIINELFGGNNYGRRSR